jgi:hypothetical protein
VRFVSRGARVSWAALACVAGASAPSVAAAIDDPGRDFGFATLRERLRLSASLRYEGAINTRNAHFQKSELVFEPELDARLPWDLALTAIGRLRYDPFDRIEPGSPPQPEVSTLSRRGFISDEVDVELREFYVEGALGRTLFTVGKQQIVWGQADGLKVLDVVNPQDFREFILPEFSHSRIPLWAVNVEIPLGGVTGQIVWIPDQTYHVLPERDGSRNALGSSRSRRHASSRRRHRACRSASSTSTGRSGSSRIRTSGCAFPASLPDGT